MDARHRAESLSMLAGLSVSASAEFRPVAFDISGRAAVTVGAGSSDDPELIRFVSVFVRSAEEWEYIGGSRSNTGRDLERSAHHGVDVPQPIGGGSILVPLEPTAAVDEREYVRWAIFWIPRGFSEMESSRGRRKTLEPGAANVVCWIESADSSQGSTFVFTNGSEPRSASFSIIVPADTVG